MEGFEENSVQKPYRDEDKREPLQQQEQQQTEVGLGFHSSPPLLCPHPNLDPAPPPYDLDKQSMNGEELRNQIIVDEEPLTQQTINEELQKQGILNEELQNLALGEGGTADTDHGEEDGNGEGCKRNEIDANHEEVFNEEVVFNEEDEVADSPDDKNLDEDINDDTHLDEHDNGKTDNDEEGVEGTENVGEDSELALASKDGRYRRYYYPLRPDAEDCSYYMRTGTCKFGSNCKFNHPLRRRNQAAKEKVKENEENPERTGQIECKYYLTSGGCKFGKACRYNHSQGKILVSPVLELNFLGLPIRPGEKECPYYMRNGSCKYGSNCRFNHPDPTTVGGADTSGYENGGSVSLQGSSQSPMPSWSSPRTLNETAPFVPMMLSPNQGIPSPSSEWNGYQAPVYPATERSLPTPPAFSMNNPVNETNFYPHHQLQVVVDDFPERPGQPECSYFLKTGDCKFRSGCKFHHPKNRNLKAPACTLSDKGLPLRPDQNICMHYSRYGICKFGPACKFDHPVNYANSASSVGSEPDHPPFGNYAGTGSGNGN